MTAPLRFERPVKPEPQPQQQMQLVICERCASVRVAIPAAFEGVISPQLKPCPVCYPKPVGPEPWVEAPWVTGVTKMPLGEVKDGD